MINKTNLFFIGGYHLLLFIALPIYLCFQFPSLLLIGLSALLVYITGLAITAGYHRLYSHLTYKTNPAVEAVLLFFGSMAVQGSAIQWCHDHRLHHAHVDTDTDPYSIKKGFWYAHILWMFFESREVDLKVVSDLWRSRMIRFQHRHYAFCIIVTNFIAFLALWAITGDAWGSFVFGTLARLFCLHHLTWFINSLAHTWGTQAYSREHSAVDNYVISMLTFGEGYHNFHHTFPQDFRNGIRWYHFDPTKWLIWVLAKMKLAWGLRKVDDVRITRQMMLDHRKILVDKLSSTFYAQRDLLEAKIAEIQDSLVERLNQLQQLCAQSRDNAKRDASEIAKEIRATRRALKQEWRRWKSFVRSVEKLQPLIPA